MQSYINRKRWTVMDISELVFTSLGPLLYNIIFISLWILWFVFHTEEENQKIKSFFKRYLADNRLFYSITGILIVIFLFLLFSYAIANTDVDDAITSAVQAFLDGRNPYQEDVVEHHTPSGIVYGRYHYFPPDLLTYSIFYHFFGSFLFPLLSTYWFVPLHFLLLVPSYWIVTCIVDWPHHKILPFFLLLVTPFLFTNSMLMLFFFLIGYYLYEIREQFTLGMVFYVLAASVKYMVGFIIIFYFYRTLRELQKEENLLRNWQYVGQKLTPYFVSSLVLTIFSLPFGVIDVIISVFIYQGFTPFREEVAQSAGPLLIEVLKLIKLESLYLPIAGIVTILFLVLVRNQPTFDQIIHFSFLSMVILPFYATELFITLPFYWWFKEGVKSFTNGNSGNLPPK